MFRRKRGNFPLKGKDGVCRIRGCPQMGKMLKRLDNHLLKYHKGVTRAENDRQPHFSSKSCKSRVTCMLPGCYKEVLHFSRHLKNIHSMSVADYHTIEKEKKEIKNKIKQNPATDDQRSDERSEAKKKKERHVDNFKEDESTGKICEVVPETDSSDLESLSEQEISDQIQSDEDVQVPETDLSDDALSEQENSDEMISDKLISDDYCKEKLRYLVHNTSPDGLRFLLVFMRRKGSLAEFYRSTLCKDVLGKMPFSTIREIYLHRKHLTSFYRLAEHYPYPDNKTIMISSCLACDVMEKGHCSCPVLPKSFYVFCRQKCSSDLNCAKCVNFDKGPSHRCFDFFHCQLCNERYKASSKYQPYPYTG